MPAVPRSLLSLGASLLSARASLRLRREANAAAAQDAVFKNLVRELSRCSVWGLAGVEPGIAYDSFRARVPLHGHKDLAPYVERMKRGEPGVLWPGLCRTFCLTSGTTTGSARSVPMTPAMLDHFKQAALTSILWYTLRRRSTRVFRGRHLFLGGSAPLEQIPGSGEFDAYAGDLSAIAALNLPRWVEKNLYEPGAEVSRIADWSERIAAITRRTAGADISLIGGTPDGVLTLAAAVRAHAAGAGRAARNLREVWPNLECVMHGGLPMAPFQDELRAALGPGVEFHEVYPASEAFIAAQDPEASPGLRLLAASGVFYEFLPMEDFDEARLGALGSKAVPLAAVSEGVDYALVATTPAGFARYVVGDVVRFVSTKPHRLTYVGRTALRLNAFGEDVTERDITDALVNVCRRNGWTAVNFHVAPLRAEPGTGARAGRHEWWVELRAGTVTTPTGPVLAPELDAELRRLRPGYGRLRAAGQIDAPFVRLVMPGVFEQWSRFHGKWGGQSKMPRCRGDRVIADEVGRALQFAKD